VTIATELEHLVEEVIKCIQRNAKPDDPEQERAIKKAYRVAIQLINGAHYSEAVTILESFSKNKR